MKKQKKIILTLIILVVFIVNYSICKFYFLSNLAVLNEQKRYYSQVKNKIANIKQQRIKLEKLEKDNEQLKRNVETLNTIAPKEIDTPQLAYDFYTSCLEYKVKGEELRFDLGDEQKKDEGKKEDANFKKLTITLKISGNRNNLEHYLRNLQGITKRQLNIKSIAIGERLNDNKENNTTTNSNESTSNKESITKTFYSNIKKFNYKKLMQKDQDEKLIANDSIVNSSDVEMDKKIIDNTIEENKNNKDMNKENKIKTDEISAEIIFYQYIQGTGKEFNTDKNYDFNDKNIGFDSIADMFKKK